MKPQELVNKLISIFPAFADEWDEGEAFGYTNNDYSLHTVFLTFGPMSKEYLTEAEPKQVKEFCTLINQLVAKGGNFENAVSTCLLEHASQVSIRKIIEPFLSKEAKQELR